MVHGSTRRGALWAAPPLLFWQPGVRVAAHHVTAALHVLDVVGKAVERLQQRCCAWRVEQVVLQQPVGLQFLKRYSKHKCVLGHYYIV